MTRSLPSQTAPADGAPRRTCLGCRQVKDKKDLVRLVRNSEGRIEVDRAGKKAGRGAYLCRSRDCWEEGLKGGRLEHAFRNPVSRENRDSLVKQAEEVCEGAISGSK